MGAGTEDAIGLEPARRGGTAGSGTSPGPNCVYIYTYVNACTRTLAHVVDRKPLRLMRGRFLRANAFAFCALDLKLSGCTICASRRGN